MLFLSFVERLSSASDQRSRDGVYAGGDDGDGLGSGFFVGVLVLDDLDSVLEMVVLVTEGDNNGGDFEDPASEPCQLTEDVGRPNGCFKRFFTFS